MWAEEIWCGLGLCDGASAAGLLFWEERCSIDLFGGILEENQNHRFRVKSGFCSVGIFSNGVCLALQIVCEPLEGVGGDEWAKSGTNLEVCTLR